MTLALGMLCREGVIIAADTKVTDTNGAVTQGCKATPFVGKNETFAIANASNDANAASTMIRKIQSALQSTPFKNWTDMEEVIAYEMTEFSNAFKSPPEHQLILGAVIKGLGAGLYFCEPPNTVLPKGSYISAGGGASVADQLQDSLFRFSASYLPAQFACRQIAYLMYRAKKEQALCGGGTTATFLAADGREPEWVRSIDLKRRKKCPSSLTSFSIAPRNLRSTACQKI